MQKNSDKFSAFFPANGTVYRICKRCPSFASECPRAFLPFLSKTPRLRTHPQPEKAEQTSTRSAVLRTETFRQLRILPESPGRSGPPSVCRVQSGKRAPIACSRPMLVRSDPGHTGHSSTISRILYTKCPKKASTFAKFFPAQKDSMCCTAPSV